MASPSAPMAADAKRDAAGLALGAKAELCARALDVGLQVAAHGLGRVHLDAVAVVPRHSHGAGDVLDDDDERLPCGDGHRLLDLARLDDVGAREAGQSEQRGRGRARRRDPNLFVASQALLQMLGVRRRASRRRLRSKPFASTSRTVGSSSSRLKIARTASMPGPLPGREQRVGQRHLHQRRLLPRPARARARR